MDRVGKTCIQQLIKKQAVWNLLHKSAFANE